MIARVRFAFMIIVFCLLCGILGGAIAALWKAPIAGFMIGGLIGLVYLGICIAAADKFALDVYEAELLDSGVAPRLYEMVQEISEQAGIDPMPLIYLVPLNAPNAFVVGRSARGSVLALTNGLTQNLEREEVRATLAQLMARISSGEAVLSTMAATLAGLSLQGARSASANDTLGDHLTIDPEAGMTVLGKALLAVLLLPSILLLQIAFDPQSVKTADAQAAVWTGDPQALASALRKIEAGLPKTGWGSSGYNPATAMLFAVPPLPPKSLLGADVPFWLRVQQFFPSTSPRRQSGHSLSVNCEALLLSLLQRDKPCGDSL